MSQSKRGRWFGLLLHVFRALVFVPANTYTALKIQLGFK